MEILKKLYKTFEYIEPMGPFSLGPARNEGRLEGGMGPFSLGPPEGLRDPMGPFSLGPARNEGRLEGGHGSLQPWGSQDAI